MDDRDSTRRPHNGVCSLWGELPCHAARPAAVTTSIPPSMPTGEQVFLKEGGVLVSSTRFVVESQTYSLANITSAGMGKAGGWRSTILAVGLGTIVVFDVLLAGVLVNWPIPLLFVLTVITGGGIALLALVYPMIPLRYAIELTTAAGEVQALTNLEHERADRILDAINRAIVARG